MELPETARAFVAGAFDLLRKEFVVPTPIYHPYVQVGRDYFGDTIRAVPAYRDLEAQLNDRYPDRFGPDLKPRRREFASTYMMSLLEASIARCGRFAYHDQKDHFDPDNEAVSESIDELITVLDSPTYEVACCRFVSYLTTDDFAELTFGDITVVPECDEYDGLTTRIAREIPGAWAAYNRDDPRPYDPPHSLLIARQRTDDHDPWDVAQRLSHRLESFLRVVRLSTAGTVFSVFEVTGVTTLVRRMNPSMTEFRVGPSLVRRTAWLNRQQQPAFEALGRLVEQADVKREGMVATSFDVAVGKFHASTHQRHPYDALVDLATAFEAILVASKKETEGLTLRLRTRAAALLAADDDPGTEVFKDVGLLYDLRSTLVHGGQIREVDLRRNVRKISTMPDGEVNDSFGVAISRAVDRMRDLVRRAILARLCLAAEPDPVWPFSGDTAVDAQLADDETRAKWRAGWRDKLAALGLAQTAHPASAAVDFLTPHEQEAQARRRSPAESSGPPAAAP